MKIIAAILFCIAAEFAIGALLLGLMLCGGCTGTVMSDKLQVMSRPAAVAPLATHNSSLITVPSFSLTLSPAGRLFILDTSTDLQHWFVFCEASNTVTLVNDYAVARFWRIGLQL